MKYLVIIFSIIAISCSSTQKMDVVSTTAKGSQLHKDFFGYWAFHHMEDSNGVIVSETYKELSGNVPKEMFPSLNKGKISISPTLPDIDLNSNYTYKRILSDGRISEEGNWTIEDNKIKYATFSEKNTRAYKMLKFAESNLNRTLEYDKKGRIISQSENNIIRQTKTELVLPFEKVYRAVFVLKQ